jgi:hypothetical protein
LRAVGGEVQEEVIYGLFFLSARHGGAGIKTCLAVLFLENPMIAAYRNMFNADLGIAFTELGETATIQTQTSVPVVPHVESAGNTVDDMGELPTAALMLVVRTVSLTVTPIVGGLVAYKSRNYRIEDIQRHQGEQAITLVLSRDTGG